MRANKLRLQDAREPWSHTTPARDAVPGMREQSPARESALRVLFVAHSSNPGGTESSFGRLLETLGTDTDLRITAAYPTSGMLAEKWGHVVPHIDYRAGSLPPSPRLKSYAGWAYRRARQGSTFREAVLEARPDAVVSFTSVLTVPLEICAQLRIPSVAYVREFVEPSIVRERLWTYLGRRADRLVAVSGPLAAALEPYARGRVRLIHDGVPLGVVMHSAPWPPSPPLISFYGGYDPAKGGELFIRAAGILHRSLATARFAYYGAARPVHASYRGSVRRLASTHGLLDRLSFIETTDFAGTFGDASVVVMPSSREGLGLVALEAMSHGVPVVASRTGGLVDAVEDGVTGALVSPGHVAGFAEAVARLIADPAQLVESGRRARLRVERHFSIGQAADGLKRAILEAVRDPRGTPKGDDD